MPDLETPGVTAPTRRRRYSRSAYLKATVSLTPTKVHMLGYLAELRFLSLPQLARLCCPSERRDLSEKSARRHLRELFDAGLADVLPISRAALATSGEPNDASLLYGSAPNIYAPTARALAALHQVGFISGEEAKRPLATYGPRNSLFLAHELAVRDVRVWLEGCTKATGHEIECWRDGREAVIDLRREQVPFSVRPDAWFAYHLGKTVLVGLVEVDQGTERGNRQWDEKIKAYSQLFHSQRLPEVTGYQNARVLVVVPSEKRLDRLAAMIAGQTSPLMTQRFWLTCREALKEGDLKQLCWRQPGQSRLLSLI